MDLGYLNLQPEAENKFNINLEEGEKIIFATVMPTFGTEKDRMIGSNCEFTMTNQRMLINNHAGIWTLDIAEDLAACKKVEGGFWKFKYAYYAIDLSEDVIFDNGQQRLSGYHFYFAKEDMDRFGELMENLLK